MLMAELVTKLKVDDAEFQSKMIKAAGAAGKFTGNMLVGLAKIGAAATALATGAFALLTNTILDTADSLDSFIDQANKLSIMTGELQKLSYAAKLSGVSNESLNSSLKRMIKTIADAEGGSKKANSAIASLGLQLKDLQGLSPDQQFIKISEALKAMPSSSQQASAALAIFSRSGIDQLNLLRSDIKAAGTEFESLGGVISQTQADAIQKFGDSKDKLAGIWEAFKIQLTAQVVPALEKVYTWITDTIVKMGGIGNVANTVAQYIVAGMQIAVKAFQGFLDVIMAVITGLRQVKLAILEARQGFNNLNFSLGGGDIDFSRLDEIARLKRDIAANKGAGVTSGLQKGLATVQGTLQQQNKQEVAVKLDVEPSDLFYVRMSEVAKKTSANIIAEEARKVSA